MDDEKPSGARRRRRRVGVLVGVVIAVVVLALIAFVVVVVKEKTTVDPTAALAAPPGPKAVIAADASPTKAVAQAAFESLTCPPSGVTPVVADPGAADDYVATCDSVNGSKYLLGPSLVSGSEVTSATADATTAGGGDPAATGKFQIDVFFNAQGTKDFASATNVLYQNCAALQVPCQLAITLYGVVVSAPQINQGPITGGSATISGTYTQQQAQNLAAVLNYGSLPTLFTQVSADVVTGTGTEHLTFEAVGPPTPTGSAVDRTMTIIRERISELGIADTTVASVQITGHAVPGIVVTCPVADQAEVSDVFTSSALMFRPVLATQY